MKEDELQPPTRPPHKGTGPALPKPTSKKRWLVVLLAVILLIGAVAYVLVGRNHNRTAKDNIYKSQGESKDQEEASKPLTEEENSLLGAKNSAEVKVTKSGFKPTVITVKPNTKVTWTTDDANAYGIAANAGSKTTKYFGSKKNIDLHTLYAARFTDQGTYTYHDTMNPTNNGTVIVAN